MVVHSSTKTAIQDAAKRAGQTSTAYIRSVLEKHLEIDEHTQKRARGGWAIVHGAAWSVEELREMIARVEAGDRDAIRQIWLDEAMAALNRVQNAEPW